MGKQISETDYNSARERLNNCRVAGCRNASGNDEDTFCNSCKSAFKVVREYKRTHSHTQPARVR